MSRGVPRIDLADQRFGKLTAIKPVGRKNDKIVWLCRCDCGKTLNVVAGSLRSGNTKSCGAVDCCPRTKHGHTSRGRVSSTWTCWNGMINRCYNPNSDWYHRYGGRGITICDRWLGKDGFQHFLMDMGEKPPGLTIDRFPDKDGPYAPDNCRWATKQEQAINRSVTKLTEDLVKEIHALHTLGESNASIAARMDVSPSHVSKILSGAKWKGSKESA